MNSTINKYVNAVKSLPLRSHTDTVVPISFPVKRSRSIFSAPEPNEFQDSTHFHGKARANSVNSVPRMSSIAFIKSLIGVHSSYIFVTRRVVVSKAYAGRTNAIFLVTMEGGRGLKKHGTRVKIHSGLAYINRKSNIASKPF